jgi:GT2 family glycosyltransferase
MVGDSEIGNPPQVTAVVVTYNAMDLLRECLHSLVGQDYPNLKTVVVDNGSTDGSRDMIGEEFPEAVVVGCGENLGFGPGADRGIRRALDEGAEWVFLLNNDATVASDCISKLVGSASRFDAGLVGPKILYHTPPDLIWSAGGRVSLWTGAIEHIGLREPDHGQHDSPREVGYLSGCALLADTRVFEQAGTFDAAFYPAYVEDVDLCFRARRAGFRVLYEPGARARHRISASSGGGVTAYKARLRIAHTILFFRRYARWYHWPSLLLAVAARSTAYLVRCLLRGEWETLAAIGRAAAAVVASPLRRKRAGKLGSQVTNREACDG